MNTEKISLRRFAESDAERLASLANNSNIARFMANRFPHPYTREAACDFIKQATSKNPIQLFAIDLQGELIGGIGLHEMNDIFIKNMEIGYWLGEAYWGKGYALQAIEQICKYGFDTFDVNRLFCRVFGNNERSIRLMKKAGFNQEAFFEKTIWKNNEFLDEYIFALRRP